MGTHSTVRPSANLDRTTGHAGQALRLFVIGLFAVLAPLGQRTQAQAATLPGTVQAALRQAQLPADSLSVVVVRVQDPVAHARLSHQAQLPRNPASLIKLVTTVAALDVMGPAFTWRTQVATDGTLQDGVLRGNLYLKGEGDPGWVMEKLWQLMRRIRGLGIERIEGDVVLDRSAFELPAHDAAAFDGDVLKPYNVGPDAWLVNHHAVSLFFVPDPGARVARVLAEPPMAGVNLPAQLPLSAGPCDDHRARVDLDIAAPSPAQPFGAWRFKGAFPASCGDKRWSVAAPSGPAFSQQVIKALWLAVGGQLSGQVRDGLVPAHAQLRLQADAGPLAEAVVRINKFSNNVMADQVFLTLGRAAAAEGLPTGSPWPTATWELARTQVQRWWAQRLPQSRAPTLVNGSGLSRDARIEAHSLAELLHWAWLQPFYPELAASLPVTGSDGTLKRSKAQAWAHLKTGSLRDASGIAGYVDGLAGQRWVVVAIVNHPQANRARPVLDAVVDWASQQR